MTGGSGASAGNVGWLPEPTILAASWSPTREERPEVLVIECCVEITRVHEAASRSCEDGMQAKEFGCPGRHCGPGQGATMCVETGSGRCRCPEHAAGSDLVEEKSAPSSRLEEQWTATPEPTRCAVGPGAVTLKGSSWSRPAWRTRSTADRREFLQQEIVSGPALTSAVMAPASAQPKRKSQLTMVRRTPAGVAAAVGSSRGFVRREDAWPRPTAPTGRLSAHDQPEKNIADASPGIIP